jgi:hypothetical protein
VPAHYNRSKPTAMNIYTRALTPAKRQAQSKAVDVLFNRIPQQVVCSETGVFPRTQHLSPD